MVGIPHAIKGTGIYMYVVLDDHATSTDVSDELKQHIRKVIGPIATPDCIHVASGLPKTRSGKIMRRILRAIAKGEYTTLGDTSTLADPIVVSQLIDEHKQSS